MTEQAIRAVEKAYDDTWCAGDIDGLLACFDSEAVLVNPFGEVARGHAEIRRELTRVLHALGGDSRHTSVITRVELVTGDVAVVDGEAYLQGVRGEGSTAGLHHRFTDVLVRRGPGWVIAHVRAYGLLDRSRADVDDAGAASRL